MIRYQLVLSDRWTVLTNNGASTVAVPPAPPSPAAKRRRLPAPAWVGNRHRTWHFLLRAFPKQRTNLREEEQARRWSVVIRLFFVEGKSRRQVAQILGCSVEIVRAILQRIRFVDSGLRKDGKEHTGRRRGRPRARPHKRRKHRKQPTVLPEPTYYTPEWEVDDQDEQDGEDQDELESDDAEAAEE